MAGRSNHPKPRSPGVERRSRSWKREGSFIQIAYQMGELMVSWFSSILLPFLYSGHFLYTSPNTVPGARTSLVSVEAASEETHCITFSFAIAQAGGVQELVVKTGPEGEEEYIWRVPASENSDWRIGQVPTKGRVMFEAVEGEDLTGYVVLDQVG